LQGPGDAQGLAHHLASVGPARRQPGRGARVRVPEADRLGQVTPQQLGLGPA
jgi:hypothetical protein